MNITELTQQIKDKALSLGFNAVGVAKAEEIEGFKPMLTQWLEAGYHGSMSYMERNFEKRIDPTVLVEGAQSVVSLLTSYYPEKLQDPTVPQIAKYAYGTDYHFVIKDKMQELWNFILIEHPELDGRMFVDSAPVSDKLWATKAGLGWIGKNACLINREIGSFVFISELIINLPLDYDEPYRSNFCGSCTKCIDACPTQAIVQPGVIDSPRCISYQTIENKTEHIPSELSVSFENRLFGCDICQDVCPWNKKPFITQIPEFKPHDQFFDLDRDDWSNMEAERFNVIFRKSALKRAKLKGLKRNFEAIVGNKPLEEN